MKNAKKAPKKVSNIMKKMNFMLYTVFGMQFVIICTYASLSMMWMRDNPNYVSFYEITTSMTFGGWIIQLLTFWVAYSHLIPISLYVIIEMLKLSQAYLIGGDVRMYDLETDKFGMCRNSDLIEELGQVDFVFSDKTGTLT